MTKGRAATVLSTFALAALPASATAMPVTIGSNLTTVANANNPCNGDPCTITNTVLQPSAIAPGGLTSPVSGTITSWRAAAGGTATNISLRVLHPAGTATFLGAGTSAAQTIMNLGGPFPTSLPISAGDSIGLNNPNSGLVLGTNPSASSLRWVQPPLADGSTRLGSAGGAFETLVQATIEPVPVITVASTAPKQKLKRASIVITTDKPVSASVTGTRRANAVTQALGAGANTVPITFPKKVAKKLKKKLRKKKGKKKRTLSLTASVTVTDPVGNTAAGSATFKLKK